MEKGIKQGNLHMFVSGTGKDEKWQRRFYVLHGYTSTTKARLDCHESEMSFKSNKTELYTYCFDDVAEIKYRETTGPSSEHKHTCEVVCKQQVMVFSAPTSDVMQGWVMAMMSLKFESEQRRESTTNDVPCRNVIYEPLDIVSRMTAIVRIEETDASKRCHLGDAKYSLHVCPSDIVLMDLKSKEIRQQWLYRYIRSYTCSPTVFSFEAGRRCASGEGLFSFKTVMAAELSAEVQEAVRGLQKTDPDPDEDLYIPMNKQTPTSQQENAENTTNAKSTTKPTAQRVCYENIAEKSPAGSRSFTVTDSLTLVGKQGLTEDKTGANSTGKSVVPRVCYENVAAHPTPLDAPSLSTKKSVVERVCYENVSTNPTAPGEHVTPQEWMFVVEVGDTEASKRCNLNSAEYQLHFDTDGIKLEDPSTKAVVQEWPYKFIRRYGCSPELFLLEVGRRAASGEGLFKFKTTKPDHLQNALQTRRSHERNHSVSSSVAKTNQQQGATYATLDRPVVGRDDVHQYVAVVHEPAAVSGGVR